MTEHLSTELLNGYWRKRLSPAELANVDEHLAACDSCRQALDEINPARSAVLSLDNEFKASLSEQPVHLEYEQLAGYADGELSEVDREIVEGHLETCSECKQDAREFEAIRREIAARSTAKPAPVVPLRFWKRASAKGQFSRLQIAALAASLILIATVAGILIVPRLRNSDETAKTSTQPSIETPSNRTENQNSNKSEPEPGGAAGNILYSIHDGSMQVTLDNEGHLKGLEAAPDSYQRAVKNALASGRLETPSSLAALSENAGRLMGGGQDGVHFALISPVGTVVRSERPAFKWQALRGATGYVVSIFDSSYNKIATSERLSATEWMPAQPFVRGSAYTWQVTAILKDEEIKSPVPPAPQARFEVLAGARADELSRAEKSLADSRLLRGVLYARHGLLDDAEQQFIPLLDENPNSQIIHSLLTSLQKMRRSR